VRRGRGVFTLALRQNFNIAIGLSPPLAEAGAPRTASGTDKTAPLRLVPDIDATRQLRQPIG
jgi:hypothetical protein